jgi:tRNA pseudouridine38-40 synthase
MSINQPIAPHSRIALGIEYDGTAYAGWQSQQGGNGIQDALQRALSRVADCPIIVHCAGRTDAGVHAWGQVVHFDSPVARCERAWLMGGNTHLPDDVRIIWAQPVNSEFHARSSALARWYRYSILNRKVASALQRRQTTWCFYMLDADAMQRAAQALLGEQDFSAYRAASCQSQSPKRFMHFIKVRRQDDLVHIDICANAFVHHMVRNIVGVLMEIGMGRRPVEWAFELLQGRDRRLAAATAPAHGLYLAGVCYPHEFGLPRAAVFDELVAGVGRFG